MVLLTSSFVNSFLKVDLSFCFFYFVLNKIFGCLDCLFCQKVLFFML